MLKRNNKPFLLFLMIAFLILLYLFNQYMTIQNKQLKEEQHMEDFRALTIEPKKIPNAEQNDAAASSKYNNHIPKAEHSFIPKDNSIDDQTKSSTYETPNMDCILKIPDINLEKIVYTGVERNHLLEDYNLVTAADDMNYKNGGNYIICGHASRLYGHSLNRLKEIQKDMNLYIETKTGTDCYIIKNIFYEDRNLSSKYFEQTNSQLVTIISCARYVSDTSYIIIQAYPSNSK